MGAMVKTKAVNITKRTSIHLKDMNIRLAKSIGRIVIADHIDIARRLYRAWSAISRLCRYCKQSRWQQAKNHDNRQHGRKESRKNVFTCFVQNCKPPFKGSDDRFGDLLRISPPAYISPPPPFMTLKHTPGVDCLESCIY